MVQHRHKVIQAVRDEKAAAPAFDDVRSKASGAGSTWRNFALIILCASNVATLVHFREQATNLGVEAGEATRLHTHVKLLEGKIAGLDGQLTDQREIVGQREKMVSSHKETIEALTARLEAKEVALKDLMGQSALLEEHQTRIEELRAEVEAKDTALRAAEQTSDSLQKAEEKYENSIRLLQKQDLAFNRLRWGTGEARRVLLSMASGEEIELEMAPFEQMPHTVHWFLTLIETGFWNGCALIRNAGHVMQFNCNGRSPPHDYQPSIAFQEFDPSYHHEGYTCGVAGRPGGVDWYVNLMDNQVSHGPGGQGGPDADPCFARIIRGKEAIQQWHQSLPSEGLGFLEPQKFLRIVSARILSRH